MSPERIALLQDLASACGIAVLAVPAFGLNLRKKALHRIDRIVAGRATTGDASALDAIAEEVRAERASSVAGWRPIDQTCLYVGYFLVLGSALWRLVA